MTIGELAKRTGVTASALRFYEARGLVQPGGDAVL
ncbi:MAG: MerR family transcriptional regulator [Firmicutes bacterium]|nr:MerR family transcriptional regulator [Bacillota bacterium]